ncbi:hypothetical protein H2203_003929 [Taxawa tesnikishii (nom. ined.)]|nr:hypothetical protein H2203_003929 [Dothideales sp. JES 119]
MSDQSGQAPQKGRLVSHFESLSAEKQGSGWSNLWDQGESDLWDRGFPSPALIDYIEGKQDLLIPTNADGSRKRLLYP